MKSFNFGEALSFMEIGETVCLELDWVLVIGLGLVTASVVCFAKYRRKIKTKKKS